MSVFAEIRGKIKRADTLHRLIIINVSFFLLYRIIKAVLGLYRYDFDEFLDIKDWLAVPSSLSFLLVHPWTLITYMFVHEEFLHILFNMLWLYWMGMLFKEYLGAKKLLAVYLLGGISGALLFIISFNVFPLFSAVSSDSFTIGASGSVLAITAAIATLLPDYPINLLFFGQVKLKYIAIVNIILDMINISGENAGGHFAHLGGALFGFIYIRQLQKGNDLGGWLIKLTEWVARFFSTKSKIKIVHSRYNPDEQYNVKKQSQEEIIDRILDKISRSGYSSLTSEEKEILFKASKNKN